MGIKIKDILIALFIISLCSAFILGMIYWPEFKKDGTWKGNLYYVTMASVLYCCGVVFNILARTNFVKGASLIAMGIFGWNLTVELYLDPTDWAALDYGLLGIVALNTLLSGIIIEVIKRKTNK